MQDICDFDCKFLQPKSLAKLQHMVVQKIPVPTPRMVIENANGEGGLSSQKMYELWSLTGNSEEPSFWGRGGGGMDFFGTTHQFQLQAHFGGFSQIVVIII